MSSSDLSNIVNRMKHQYNTTLNWDVVVNYGETELNNLLASAHSADPTGNTTIQKLECSLTATDDFHAEDYTINYTLNLGPPSITFLDTDSGAACNLLIPITGGTAEILDSTTPSQSFGEGIYTLGLNTLLLATAKGGVVDKASIERATSYDEPFIFSASSEESGIVYIDFETSKELVVELKATGITGHAAFIDNHIGDLKDIIRDQFLTTYKDVIYELARTNNIKPQGGIQLVPKSFMFTTHTPLGRETILTLFIQTGDDDRGEKDILHSRWDVLWRSNLGCPPIPSGQTASVILAKNTIFTAMVEPGLEKQGYSSQLDDTTGSLQLQVDTKKELHEPKDSESTTYSSITRHTAIDLVLPKLQLVLQQDSSKPYCRGAWEYSYKFDWDEYHAYGETGSDEHGTVTVTNTLAEDTYPVILEDEYTLKMNYQIRKDKWNVTTKPDSQGFWDIINGGSETTPSWVKDLNVLLPEMNIDLGSLNFFLTTNLLLPSGNVIDIDMSAGVQIPGDFYLVGNVADV